MTTLASPRRVMAPYRGVLALPGVRGLFLIALLARVPVTAAGVTLTLHVVLDLHHGYAAAGLVGTATTVASAVGAPLLGRFVDRRGLRPMLVVTTLAEALFWAASPRLPYPVLLAAAAVAGLLTLPVFGVIRQSIAALVPEQQRRQAYALDSMSVELSFMIGPALAVFAVTAVSARATMFAIGAGITLSGLALYLFNPPVRAGHEEHAPVPRRQWLTGRMVTLLAVGTVATLVLSGTDVAVVAALRASGQLSFTGLVLAVWAAYSLIGGFVYGAQHRAIPPLALVAALCALTIPIGLASGHWLLLCLAILPAGALCAPTLAATADAVSRLAPPAVRGEAMGLHSSAITVGLALGAPLAGAVIDNSHHPGWGFAAAGVVGLVVTAVAGLTLVRRRLARRP
ncbi:MFS transporter [Rhizomonospora bruguierae]|uniref:MFS transporter n=1 Tax=Rhizomonospora bruguierae TaxID=1581705 RepID=UPI0020C12065|nr:MFS transporter [Micromonospora sp. NBRC 107566]